jgi:hypothetical protein
VNQTKPPSARTILLSGLGAGTASAFSTWAAGRGIHQPLKVAIAAMIMTGFGLLAWVDLRRVCAWICLFLAEWLMVGVHAPAMAGHMVAGVAAFVSVAKANLGHFVST